MLSLIKRIGMGATLVAATAGGLVGPASAANSSNSLSSSSDPSTYIAPLHPLNGSGVTGFANLSLNSEQPGASLRASVNARGTEPNQVHLMHIHGMLDGKKAECPTIAADSNRDRLVSVFEGAPFYGPIKVNFTSPATAFGPPTRTDLFAPFAGAPVVANFPHSNSSGRFSYNQAIPFDTNNQFAVEALDSLMPLSDQHIVIHGGFAPESVDTAGGNPNKIVYDALLPVACGPIIQTHRGSSAGDSQGNANGSNGQGAGGVVFGNTGPGSNNEVRIRNDNRFDVRNTNNLTLRNSNDQSSRSGLVRLSSNTQAGSARSGNADNTASTNSMLRLINMSFGIK